MVRWMCGVKLQDRVSSKGLRETLGLDDIISELQRNKLRCYGHVLRPSKHLLQILLSVKCSLWKATSGKAKVVCARDVHFAN